MKEMSDLFCSKAAVGGNYNLTRDSVMDNEILCPKIRKYYAELLNEYIESLRMGKH